MSGPVAPVSAVADVLALHGADGWLTPPVRAVVPAPAAVIGRAVCLAIDPVDSGGSIRPLHELVSEPLEGCVVVVASSGVGGAVWGEIMSRAARMQGAVGAVVDGVVRDVPAMHAEELPVYARSLGVVGPRGLASARRAPAGVHIGDTTVCDGDLVVLDDTGVVRIPAALIETVLEHASLYAAAESRLLEDLAAGRPLTSAYLHKQEAVAAIIAAVSTNSPRGSGDDLSGARP
jgi:regulator of RNase E activity RraA